MSETAVLGSEIHQRVLAFIPSPSFSEWHLGPLTIRMYAICIILGVIVATILGNRRWVSRGGRPGTVLDLVLWAVPFGMVGARLYHVITDPELYFTPGHNPWRAFAIWEGGLGIWGAVAGGGLGVWIACRRRGIPMPAMVDAIAPCLPVAQAIGRFGNWFNQELIGRPTTLPWGLEIAPAYRPDGYEQYATFHPTFLYEAIWCLIIAGVVLLADRRFRLGHGRAFALYVALYTLGRSGVEAMRIDTANHFFGLRLNDWVSLFVFLGAVAYLIISAKLRPGRETIVEPSHGAHAADPATATEDEADPAQEPEDVDDHAGTPAEAGESAEAEAFGEPAEAEEPAESADQDDGPKDSAAAGPSGTVSGPPASG